MAPEAPTRETGVSVDPHYELKKPLRRNVYRTIRLDEEVADIIAEQSRLERTNDVHVIQRAEDRYAHWHLWEEKFGFISVPTSMERKLMSALTDEQARELAGTWPRHSPAIL